MKPDLSKDTPVAEVSAAELAAWFTEISVGSMTLFLAHADDGVIWGRVENQQLLLAGDVMPEVKVALRPATLQQARLFGSAGEVFMWRDGSVFRVRRIMDGEATPDNALLLEHYWLWGTRVVRTAGGFMLLEEGAQGLRHAPPIATLTEGRRAALLVRHYVAHDPEGRARISASRLFGLDAVGAEARKP
jgi:CRISPR-associated protein (TIGR03984 family)